MDSLFASMQLSQCGMETGGLAVSLFLGGAVGGITHCTGMCGPFVLAQVATRLEGTPAADMREWHRVTGAALVPYHLGRATTYAMLGGIGAFAAGKISDIAGLHWLSGGLLLAAALLMAGMAVPRLKGLVTGTSGQGWWASRVGRLARPLFGAPVGWRGYGLGALLGFIPCGMVYGAVTAASASGDFVSGILAMLAFAAGTVPGLVAVGLAGHLAGHRWKTAALRFAPLLLLLNAGVLTMLAWRNLV